jgi:hypothetical protein
MPEDDPLDVFVPKFDRGGVVGLAVLLSTLMISVTCGPLCPGPTRDFEGFTRLHGVDAALSQHAPVEEGIAGPIREFDEPEAFVWVKPLDNPVDRGTGGCLEPGLAEPGSGAESTGLWELGIGVEFATPRLTKILISQLWFSWWVPPLSVG